MMKAVSGYSVNSVRNMINAIQEQTGTPQNPVDWSEPDMWINERLKGEDAEIALKIWEQNNHILNPRHSYGSYVDNTSKYPDWSKRDDIKAKLKVELILLLHNQLQTMRSIRVY